jgi:hypothetical protein
MRLLILLAATTLLTVGCQKSEPAPASTKPETAPASTAKAPAAPTSVTAKSETAAVAKGTKKGPEAARAINHVIRVVPGDAKVGQEATSLIEITPKAGYKMNVEFPVKVKLTKKDGIKAKPQFGLADAELSEKMLRFKVPYTAEKAGQIDIESLADFSVCNAQSCKLVRGEKIAWAITAAE